MNKISEQEDAEGLLKKLQETFIQIYWHYRIRN